MVYEDVSLRTFLSRARTRASARARACANARPSFALADPAVNTHAHTSPHPRQVPLIDTFRAMRALSGPAARVRHCGVCNMTSGLLADLSRACSRAGVEPPEVLQVESHPYLVQGRLLRFCADLGVAVTAFSPLGAASYVELSMATPAQSALADPAIVEIAARLDCTPAQAVLAWHLRRGIACIPKSSNAARLAENLAAGGVAPRLSDEDVRAISALDRKQRFNDPGSFTQGMNSFAPIFD